MRITEPTRRRNEQARRVLLHFHAAYEQVGHLRFGIRGDDDRYAQLGLSGHEYKVATERLLIKGFLKHQGMGGTYALTDLGLSLAEDLDSVAAELPLGPVVLPAVAAPRLVGASAVVEHALADAETAIVHGRPAGAVDRTHTALHGYAKDLCARRTVTVDPDAPLPKVYTALWTQLGADRTSVTVKTLLRSLGAALEALGEMRNNASPAHPNALPDDVDAILAVNIGRTLLAYFRDRFEGIEVSERDDGTTDDSAE